LLESAPSLANLRNGTFGFRRPARVSPPFSCCRQAQLSSVRQPKRGCAVPSVKMCHPELAQTACRRARLRCVSPHTPHTESVAARFVRHELIEKKPFQAVRRGARPGSRWCALAFAIPATRRLIGKIPARSVGMRFAAGLTKPGGKAFEGRRVRRRKADCSRSPVALCCACQARCSDSGQRIIDTSWPADPIVPLPGLRPLTAPTIRATPNKSPFISVDVHTGPIPSTLRSGENLRKSDVVLTFVWASPRVLQRAIARPAPPPRWLSKATTNPDSLRSRQGCSATILRSCAYWPLAVLPQLLLLTRPHARTHEGHVALRARRLCALPRRLAGSM